MRKCSIDAINSVFAEIAKAATLYIPADRTDGSAVYTKWEEGTVWSKALNTVRSPKDFFFPPDGKPDGVQNIGQKHRNY